MRHVQGAIALGLTWREGWIPARHAAEMGDLLGEMPAIPVRSAAADRTHTFYKYCVYVPSRRPLFSRSRSSASELTTSAIQVPGYQSLSDARRYRLAAVVGDTALSFDGRTPAAVRALS